jgi:hypothetical protein
MTEFESTLVAGTTTLAEDAATVVSSVCESGGVSERLSMYDEVFLTCFKIWRTYG